MATYQITPEQNALLRLTALRHVQNLVEEMSARTDIAPEIPILDRGVIGLTLACHIAAHSIGNSLAREGVSQEDAEDALDKLVAEARSQFALGHVAGMMAIQVPEVPDVPPA